MASAQAEKLQNISSRHSLCGRLPIKTGEETRYKYINYNSTLLLNPTELYSVLNTSFRQALYRIADEETFRLTLISSLDSDDGFRCKLSKRWSMSPTTVFLGTTLRQMIKSDRRVEWNLFLPLRTGHVVPAI